MKPIVFCLLAVCCYSVASTNTKDLQLRKLKEAQRQVADVKGMVEPSLRLRTPPRDIEDCCSLSALDCFHDTLKEQFNSRGPMARFLKSLKHTLTRTALDFCVSRNVSSTCQDCASFPRTNASEFFSRLEGLIQKGVTIITN